MKNILTLAAVIVTAALLMTGCSTCCKKDGSCAKPAASLNCTNHVAFDLADCSKGCTNKFSVLTAACTNHLVLNSCTNQFGCTNQFNLLLTDCSKGCTNKLVIDLADCSKGGCTNKLSRING